MKRLCTLLLALAVSLACAFPAQASTGGNNKIRVGYFSCPSFHELDEEGRYSGYGYEYLQELAKYTGWEYEYVPATWEECLDLLARGELDLLGSAQKTPERLESFDYANLESGVSYAVLCVSVDNTYLAYEDFDAFDGMLVGILRGNSRNRQLADYCKENGFTVRTALYDSMDELCDALQAGQVDALLTSNLRKEPDERVVARFSSSPFYFATTKGNRAVLDALNYAQGQIKLTDPFFDVKLTEKYYAASKSELPVFTLAEQEYLAEHGSLRVSYDPNWGLVAYRDETTGEFKGIVADIFERLALSTGIRFTFVPAPDLETAEGLLASGEIDLISSVDRDYRPYGALTLTNAYLSIPNVIVNDPRHDLAVSETVAVTPDFLRTAVSSSLGHSFVAYPTTRDCFEALRSGEASAVYANSYVAGALRSDYRYNRFQTAALPNITDELAVALPQGADMRLLSILNKSILYLSEEEVQEAIIANTVFNRGVTLKDLLYENPLQSVLLVTVPLSLIILILVYALFLRNRANKRVDHLLYRDDLTGIWNFKYFLQSLGKALTEGKGGQYAVVYTDIRHFKDLNSTYGYAQGSQVLRHVADVLQSGVTPDELVARVSGDNFVSMLRYQDEAAFLARLKEFDARINAFSLPGQGAHRLNLSSGIYILRPEDRDPSQAVDRANDARKSVKELLSSAYAFYDASIEEELSARREIEAMMERSLEDGQFIPYFQAKFDLKTGAIVGAEALVRWKHPDRGLIQPGAFIPIFERNGFILQIDFTVFESVCRTLRRELDEGLGPVPISTNFSRLQFNHAGFVEKFIGIAERYAVPPDLLEIEVTESILDETPEFLLPALHTLRKLGFRISMDDFGSGFSSLNLLRDMPVDILKLDKDFLQKGIMGGRDLIILDGFVNMAHKLEILVICEGVETREQDSFLRALGCDAAQGFLYARPVPLEDFERRLRTACNE